jgi:MFS family permease
VSGRAALPGALLAQTGAVLRTVFANPELRRVELAFGAFNAAEWATWVAMIVFAYSRGGPTTSGLVAMGQLVPAALFAPLASSFADRFRPGRVLALTYLAMSVTMLVTGVALVANAAPLLVYVVGAIPATVLTLARPSQAALTPALARSAIELTSVNVVSGWIESASVLGAPALAGALLDASGAGAVFLVMGGIVGVGSLLVAPVSGPPAVTPVRGTVDETGDGVIATLRAERPARLLLLLLFAQFVAIGSLDVLYPVLAIGVLGHGSGWAGYFNAAFGLGGTLGIAVTAALVGRRRLMPALLAGLALWCVAFLLIAVRPTVVGVVVLLVVAGVGRIVMDVSGRTLLQRVARSDLLARLFGVLEGLSMAGLALGAILAPVFVSLGGAKLAIVCVALLLPLAAAVTGRGFFDIDRHATVPVVEIGLLRAFPVFAPLNAAILESLARSLEPAECAAGDVVIREGDEGDRFYMLAGGAVEITRGGKHVDTVHRGDGFGEVALLHGTRRNATCTVVEPARLLALGKHDFLEAVTGHPESHAEAQRLADGRRAENGGSHAGRPPAELESG